MVGILKDSHWLTVRYWILFVCLMVFNASFNNISVLLVEETIGPGENHRPVASH
jgi:hypothetical protein